jgi:hypothetical protein
MAKLAFFSLFLISRGGGVKLLDFGQKAGACESGLGVSGADLKERKEDLCFECCVLGGWQRNVNDDMCIVGN